MPRYFIDTSDGHTLTRDEGGAEHAGVEAARRAAREAAIASLVGIADAKLVNGEHQAFRVVLRDESGAVIYEANLMFDGRWVGRPE